MVREQDLPEVQHDYWNEQQQIKQGGPRTQAQVEQKTNMIGSYSFEDWLQGQARFMNQLFAASKYPQFPEGITARVMIGKIVLTMGKANETASFAGETELTQGMIRLISPEARTVYFLTGHGEPDIEASDTASLSRAKQTLESKNYTVKTLNLAATNKIPDDAKALVEAGPSNPMLDQEVTLIRQYLDKGGSLIVLIDPTVFNKLGTGADPLESYLKDTWGISLDNDVVIDLTSQSPLNAIAAQRRIRY